jgi:tetratricopeptide (TPR) repeat protein
MLLTKQLGVIIACSLIGTALFLTPRSALEKNISVDNISSLSLDKSLFNQQLESVKSNLETIDLAHLERFEQLLESSSSKTDKIIWLDSLIVRWDKLMRPGIAAEYTIQKAETSNLAEHWEIAGKRYLSMIAFFSGDDKFHIGERAVYSLNKAIETGGTNESLETLFAIATVEGTKEPMPGILKLRDIAEKNPMNLEAQLNLGFFSMQTGQYDKAVERFKKVLEIDKEYLSVRFYMSEAYLAQGNKEEAVNQLKQYIKDIDPSEKLAIEEAQKRIKNIIN